ncbi:hypothetical protein CFP56_033806, partial [Quercus suber]
GGTGYLGQHILQGFSEIQGTPFEYDLAFTYHSNLPQPLLDIVYDVSSQTVYEGVKSFCKEEDATVPVNQSNLFLNFEKHYHFWATDWLTCSKIASNLGWIDGVLSKGEKMDFFHDEFRCPVYVKDVVAIILALTSRWISDRVSRVQMAEAVADFRGYNTSLIKPVSASSVDRGVKSPADISMNLSKLVQTLKFSPTSFTDGVKLTLTTGAKS